MNYMNGYTLMAESYRKLMNEGKIEKAMADREIRIYEFLSDCNKEDLCSLVDSSAFNDIIRGYIKLAVDNTDIDEESREKVIRASQWIFDEKNATEALENYLNL